MSGGIFLMFNICLVCYYIDQGYLLEALRNSDSHITSTMTF